MVASRCASGIDAATTRSSILTPSAAKAGVDTENVNAAKSSMPRARCRGLWFCFVRACFGLSDTGKSPSTCRPGQACYARRTPIDNRRAGTVGQHVAGDLVLPGEPDILLSLRVGEKAIEGSYPACVAGDAIVQTDHHHAPPMRSLLVKLIELVAERLLVGGRVPADEGKGDDVVHVEGIRYRHEVPSAHRHDKRLVVAWFIDVVEKAEILQRLQDGDGVAHPVRVPADRLLAGDLLDRLDAVGDEALFLRARKLIGIVPYPAVSGCLMTSSYDLASDIRGSFDSFADHERAEFDPVLIHEVEHTGDALVMTVGEEGVGRQVRDALFDCVRDHTAGARDRLAAALEHEREAHRQPRAVWPEGACIAVRHVDGRCRCASGAGQAVGSGSGRECNGLKSLSAVEMRGVLCGIVHSRLHLLDALSTLLD